MLNVGYVGVIPVAATDVVVCAAVVADIVVIESNVVDGALVLGFDVSGCKAVLVANAAFLVTPNFHLNFIAWI